LYLQEGVDRINRWADSMTVGKIPIIYAAPLDSATKLAITNAVYIKAAWLVPFDTAATRDRPFVEGDGLRVEIPTMELTADLAYRTGTRYQSVRLPFRAGLTSLYVFLPDSGVSAADLLSELPVGRWPLPDPVHDLRAVHLQLPRLHIQDTINLVPPLSAMGMGTAFDGHRADFSRMFDLRPNENASIGSASQRVTLDLDEEGAVAAAVTAIEMLVVTGVMEVPRPVQFLVNRPFLFLLRDERSGSALFVGHVAHPR
jgi:serpin B